MGEKNVRGAVREAAARLGGAEAARRDAEMLLMRAAGRDRAWLLTHADSDLQAELTPEQRALYESWIERRARQEPVQYIVGEQEFYGLPFRVTPDVLIPRPETEHLVEATIERVRSLPAARILDVGTGSGAIAVALAHALPGAQVTAVDCSRAPLAIATENAERHGVEARIRFLESDLLSAVRAESFDVVVSNPPYVADAEILEAQVAEYEPRTALFAGPTGLEVYRRLIPQAWQVLARGRCGEGLPREEKEIRQALEPRPAAGEAVTLRNNSVPPQSAGDGWLLMEIGHGQRDALAQLLADWDEVAFVDDLQGIPRVAIACRRG